MFQSLVSCLTNTFIYASNFLTFLKHEISFEKLKTIHYLFNKLLFISRKIYRFPVNSINIVNGGNYFVYIDNITHVHMTRSIRQSVVSQVSPT